MKQDIRNIGIIGLGFIGKIQAQVLNKRPLTSKYRMSSICDTNIQHFPFSTYENYNQLLSDNSIDAVSIATPPASHYDIALAALQAGKHVMLEKPPTLQLEQLHRLSDEAAKQNLTLFTAYHAASRPEVAAAKKALQDMNVHSIRVTYAESALNYHNPSGWIFDPESAGGGVLIDSGINAISILTEMLPEITFDISSCNMGFAENFKVETSVHVNFTFSGSGSGSLDADWLKHEKEQRDIELETDAGTYLIDIVHSKVFKDGELIFEPRNLGHGIVDQHIEYRDLFLRFYELMETNTSYVSERELKFVLDSYQISTR